METVCLLVLVNLYEAIFMNNVSVKVIALLFITLLTSCGGGGSDAGTTTNPPPSANVTPTANAGTDQSVNEQTIVTLSGSGTDSDGSVASYLWTQTAGESVTLTSANASTATFGSPTSISELTLTFQLTVTDNSGATSSDNVDIIVLPINDSPTTVAGVDRVVPDGSFISLLGSGTDTDGSIVSAYWSQVSGTTVSFTNPAQFDTGVSISSGLEGETLVFSLEVTDNEGATAVDELSIVIEAALTFEDYTGDVDPETLTDISIDVAEVGVPSILPATMGSNGYNTIIVDITDTYNFIIGSNTLTVIGTGAPSISVGDVIVGVTADESAGYAREVTSINGIVYSTMAATLNQVFPDADVNLSINLFNDTITTTSSIKGSDGVAQSRSRAVDILSFNRTIQHEMSPGIKAVAELEMNGAFNVNIGFSILEGTITKLNTVASANYSTAAYLDVNLTKKYVESVKKEFKPIFNKSKLIYIPTPAGVPIPVLVNVKAVPVMGAGINMSAAGTLKYGFKVGGAVRAGFEYANESLTNIAEFNPYMNKIGPDYTLAGGLNMNAQASIAVIVTLYDINVDIPVIGKLEFTGPGLGVDLGPYAKFKVDTKFDSTANPNLTCALDLSVGINSDLSIDLGTLGSQINVSNPENINLYNLNKSLWNSAECPFGPSIGNLTGTVMDSDNETLIDVSVRVENDIGEVVAETTTESNGQYELSEIAVGAYKVFYTKQDYKEAFASLVIAENETIEIPMILAIDEVADGEGILRLNVIGTVLPRTNISDANVVIREGANSPNGEYVTRVYSGATATDITLKSGWYTLVITKDGYKPSNHLAWIRTNITSTVFYNIWKNDIPPPPPPPTVAIFNGSYALTYSATKPDCQSGSGTLNLSEGIITGAITGFDLSGTVDVDGVVTGGFAIGGVVSASFWGNFIVGSGAGDWFGDGCPGTWSATLPLSE